MTCDGVPDARNRGHLIACLKVKAVNGGAPCRTEGLMVFQPGESRLAACGGRSNPDSGTRVMR